jgi:hypothetical protein
VPIRSLPDGAPYWEKTAVEIRRVIAALADPDDTANDRFKRDNRDTLERMRQADRGAGSAIEHRLGDRDRELLESNG